jgi:copper chaperone
MAKQITVEGMSCGGCEQNVETKLSDLPGVTSVEADNESDTVTVEGDVSEDDVAAVVEDAGYTAKV